MVLDGKNTVYIVCEGAAKHLGTVSSEILGNKDNLPKLASVMFLVRQDLSVNYSS